VPFFDVYIDLCINLIGEVSDSCFEWKVRIELLIFVNHHGFCTCINLTKHDLITDVIFFISGSRDILPINLNYVALVFLYTVGYHILNESVERLDLLIYDTILLEISVDDLPLVVI